MFRLPFGGHDIPWIGTSKNRASAVSDLSWVWSFALAAQPVPKDGDCLHTVPQLVDPPVKVREKGVEKGLVRTTLSVKLSLLLLRKDLLKQKLPFCTELLRLLFVIVGTVPHFSRKKHYRITRKICYVPVGDTGIYRLRVPYRIYRTWQPARN